MRPENKLAIEFDNAFVENSTRAADINATNLANFGVYGSIKNANGDTGLTFDNTVVSKNGNTGAYEYSPAQVWASNATYTFVAFAPYTDRQWSYAVTNNQAYNGVITFNNAAAQANQDLLFAAEDRTTEVIDSKPEAVALTFNHMLSRVKFHFTNSFHAGSNVALKVTDVTITDAHSTGTLAVNDGQVGDWTVGTEKFSRNFGNLNNTSLAENGGNGETEHFYLIPTEGEFNVTFKVRMTVAEGAYFDYTHNAVLKINMEKGHSYVVKTALNQTNTDPQGEMYAIEFKVEKVEDWQDFSDVALEAKTVATAQELAAAVAEGGEIRLTNNINLDDIVTRAAAAGLVVDKDLILDGNGYTVKTTAVRALQFIEGAKNVTIKNLTLDAPNSERGFQFQADGHNVVIEDVTATSGNYTVYLTATSTNSNVVVKNCDLTGLNTINVWGKDHKVNVENTKITTIDNNAAEGYASIYNNAENTTVYVNGGEVVITGSANDSFGGVVIASGASIIFNGTEGTTTIDGQPFVINYDNGYIYSFSTLAEAVETAKDGETIIMTQNATITSPVSIYNNITLDLNGKTLTAAAEGKEVDAIWVRDTAQVVITGNGTINATYDALFATGTSKLTIENGTFIGAAEAVFAQANASVEILSGSFKSTEYPQFTLNLKDSARDTASIVVKGGKYFQFNPADNAAEGEHTNFVAPGYKSVANGEWYEVVAE